LRQFEKTVVDGEEGTLFQPGVLADGINEFTFERLDDYLIA
jgi:hypothetical protein